MIKQMLLLTLMTIPTLKAQEFLVGGITTHPFMDKTTCNELTLVLVKKHCVIANATLGVGINRGNVNHYIFIGSDSFAQTMIGYKHTYYFSPFFDNVRLGASLGAYVTPSTEYDSRKVTNGLGFRIGLDAMILPIVGLDVDVTLYENKFYKVRLNNFISPIITNHSLSFQANF